MSIASEITRLSAAKNALKTKLTSAGYTVSSTAKLDDLVSSITTETLCSKTYLVTLNADVSGQQVVVNPDGDAELAAHRTDQSFVAGAIALFTVSSISFRAIIVGNNQMHTATASDTYGVYLRSSSSGVAGNYVKYSISSDPVSEPGTMSVDSDGIIRIFASSGYPMRSGSYLVICGWGETT